MQQDVGGLQRLYPSGEQGDEGVLGQSEPGPRGGAAVGGAEAFEVDAGVDDGGAGGVGVVVVDELARLLGGVGDEPVGGAHDLRLADHAGGGFGGVARGERGVLDLGHGVHGVHQGDAPAFGGEPADVAGEPVVGVDQVVVAGPVPRPGPHHAVGEGAQLRGEVLFGEPLVGAGVHVPHQHAGRQLDGGREHGGGGPGEHLDLDADGGELPGQFDDVDVHPAGVTGARLVQRRGVHAEHGHAPWSSRETVPPPTEPGGVRAHLRCLLRVGRRAAVRSLSGYNHAPPRFHFRSAPRFAKP